MCVTATERRWRGAALALATCVACNPPPPEPPCPLRASPTLRSVASQSTPFDSAFAAAGAEFRVPPSLLKAIAWVETRWHMVQGTEEFPGVPPAFGVMALRGEQLGRGSVMARVTVEAARRDPVANIRAAAALLDAYASVAEIDRSRPEAWASVVVRFSGIAVPEGRAAYTRQVDRVLPPGARLLGPAATATPTAGPCPPPPPPPPLDRDYAPALWRPSPNFNDRPTDSTGLAHVVIIHTCEGGYTGCWSWLVNPISQVSAHYVVDEEGTEISQLVREPKRAFHIAALYDCDLNRAHACTLNGVQSNHFTVGIEHAGFASQDSFPFTQLAASAALACDVTRRLDIPRDRQHIVAHGQLQPHNRTDPGPHWPWIAYLHRVQADCGELVVDDTSEFNAQKAVVSLPEAWSFAVAAPDYYGAGYHFATTAPDAVDSAVFSFRLDSAGRHAVDARWTSGTNRSPRAEYAVIDAGGATLATVRVDQRTDGGRWQPLGTWTFPAGWNRVALLRRDSSGAVVVADAVRIRR